MQHTDHAAWDCCLRICCMLMCSSFLNYYYSYVHVLSRPNMLQVLYQEAPHQARCTCGYIYCFFRFSQDQICSKSYSRRHLTRQGARARGVLRGFIVQRAARVIPFWAGDVLPGRLKEQAAHTGSGRCFGPESFRHLYAF